MTDDNHTRAAEAVRQLHDVVAQLRSEAGCPWDRQQTIESLKPYLIEEAYELLEAIDAGDTDQHRDELGDVLLQVLLHARIREEEDAFSFVDVADGLREKLVRRHPHVFGDAQAADAEDVMQKWDAIKDQERGKPRDSALDGIPASLPALHKAQRTQQRVARVGFDWEDADEVIAKVDEELAEVRQALSAGDARAVRNELGDLLFTVVNLCRTHDVHAEDALQEAVSRFARRFREVERRVQQTGRSIDDATLAAMNRHWESVKRDQA
ncbi:MAG: nucleoside triphosphate pyrophosphohydrolase [Verrucomicrobia bacterium]|nr:nucleoside triphosphate pyrophosphohydrolase [Verrucomicrobiota bacterium]